MRKIILLALLMVGTIPGNTVIAAPVSSGGRPKTANLGDEYPRAMFFRIPQNRYNPYSRWAGEFYRLNGVIYKAAHEELEHLPTSVLAANADTFVQEYPDQAVLLHYNARSRYPSLEEVHQRYSAGHWLYLPGCLVTADISETRSVVPVQNAGLFRLSVKATVDTIWNDAVVIVPVDGNGNKLWEQAEHCDLIALDNTGKTLTLKRGAYHSRARAFTGGRAWVAPHAYFGPWGDDLVWSYNFSTACPPDKDGQSAADLFVEELASYFDPDSLFAPFSGIALDVPHFSLGHSFKGRNIDADNDGTADRGIIGGSNAYGAGFYGMLKDLRARVGDDFIITADGHETINQRAVNILNGMESEGIVDVFDAYRGWSKTVNIMRFWDRFSPFADKLNYLVPKDISDDSRPMLEKMRFAAALAACLGGTYAEMGRAASENDLYGILDELISGNDHKRNWLGKPSGPARDLAKNAPDLLGGAGCSMNSAYSGAWTGTLCSLAAVDSALHVIPDAAPGGGNTNSEMTVTSPLFSIGAGDLVIYFEVLSEDTLPEYDSSVPRQIHVSVDGRKASAFTADNVMNYAPYQTWHTGMFHFRNAGPADVSIIIRIEGMGPVRIKNLTVHNAVPALVRGFEHGVVLCNPSLKDMTFDLASLFPGRDLSRLQATVNQDLSLNDGSAVGESVVVGGINGLFLAGDGPSAMFNQNQTWNRLYHTWPDVSWNGELFSINGQKVTAGRAGSGIYLKTVAGKNGVVLRPVLITK